jgi:S1-C subfamily serine protease
MTNVLEQFSAQRALLAQTVANSTCAVLLGRHHSVSGFHWRDGFIVTAAEALGGSDEVALAAAAWEGRAAVAARDLSTDVAVLRCPNSPAQEFPAAAAAAGLDTSTPQVGALVVIAGREPRGPLSSFGTVRQSGPAWQSRRGALIDRRLEFEATLDRRFEGALVAATTAQAQAMLVPGPRSTLLGIPAATIERIVAAVAQHGYLPRPYAGLRLQTLWLDTGRCLPVVAGVEADSPAAAAGLVAGDLLEAIDGQAVMGIDALAARVAQAGPGGVLALQLRRGGQSQQIELTVGEWRASRP